MLLSEVEVDQTIKLGNHESFKDSRGVVRTRSLFLETRRSTLSPIFTLYHQDKGGFKSLRRIYLEFADPTEHTFAMGVFGSLKHWKTLCACKWFEDHVAEWRVQLESQIRSDVFASLENITKKASDATALQACKLLLKEQWRGETPEKKPTKAAQAKAKKEQMRKPLEAIPGGKTDADVLGSIVRKPR